MSSTLKEVRDRAPTPLYARMLDTLITKVPLLGFMQWESTTADQLAYRRRRGTSTAPHYAPTGVMGDGASEQYDNLKAVIHPFGGVVTEPNIGMGFGDPMEELDAKIIACGRQFVTSFIGGTFADGCDFTPARAAGTLDGMDTVTPGPYWDIRANGFGAVLQVRVDGLNRWVSLMAEGDIGFGTEMGPYVAATPDATVRISSFNTNYWIDIGFDFSDLVAVVVATKVYALSFTSTTNAFDSAIRLVPTAQYAAITPAQCDLDFIDQLIDLLPPEDIAVPLAPRDYRVLLHDYRAMGGATFQTVAGFENVARYRNAYIFSQPGMPTNRTVGASVGVCSVGLGFSLTNGIKGLYKSNVPNPMQLDDSVLRAIPGATRSWGGLYVRSLPEERNLDVVPTKASWYASIMNLDAAGVAMLDGFIA